MALCRWPAEPQAEEIKPRILSAHGSEDPFVPSEQVTTFQAALDKADADWKVVAYSGAVHGFTNPSADECGVDGIGYNEWARSWRDMQILLDEVFAHER
jgi:dienelactone hydrolase